LGDTVSALTEYRFPTRFRLPVARHEVENSRPATGWHCGRISRRSVPDLYTWFEVWPRSCSPLGAGLGALRRSVRAANCGWRRLAPL